MRFVAFLLQTLMQTLMVCSKSVFAGLAIWDKLNLIIYFIIIFQYYNIYNTLFLLKIFCYNIIFYMLFNIYLNYKIIHCIRLLIRSIVIDLYECFPFGDTSQYKCRSVFVIY